MKRKEDYIKYYVDLGGDDTIIKFIYDLLYSQGISGVEPIRSMFTCGYCYYFAKILQDAFPGGEICVCYPYGHIVYIYNKIPYDIDGISSADADDFIPVSFLGEAINDFRHIDGIQYNITLRQLEKLGERWRLTQKPIEVENVWSKLADNVIKDKNIYDNITDENNDIDRYRDESYYASMKGSLLNSIEKGYITEEQAQGYLEEFCERNKLNLDHPISIL